MNVSTVVAIQTQGQHHLERWVWTYRVEYSRDCVNFKRVLDVDGNNKVPGCQIYLLINQQDKCITIAVQLYLS